MAATAVAPAKDQGGHRHTTDAETSDQLEDTTEAVFMSEDRETRGKGQLVIAVAWLVAIVVPALVVPWCADFFVTTQRGFFALTAAAYALEIGRAHV